MVISVTTHETREIHSTQVNGQIFNREEVTKIYVIEPAGKEKKQVVRGSDTIGESEGRLGLVAVVAIAWGAWLWWAFG
ncbi:hypothetical protein CI109_104708 [Kwoniella shandongensis]|uniref:Uncharacterized protein n=1 Tax=Kwoniella shandongensis TaxID=1734106 RepID=A0AAJ8MYP0_9TREE